MKLCTVVLTYDNPLYNYFDAIKRKYLESKNEEYYFVYNGTDITKNNLSNKTINYFSENKHPSGIPDMFLKFIEVIKSGILDDYDFIIRSNSSTFINVDRIREELESKKDNIYMGAYGDGWKFVSGTCVIFSRDVLKKLVDGYQSVNFYREDDVVIGNILEQANVPQTLLPQFNFNSLTSLPGIEEVRKEVLSGYTVRIRNDHDREVIDTGIWDMIADIFLLNTSI